MPWGNTKGRELTDRNKYARAIEPIKSQKYEPTPEEVERILALRASGAHGRMDPVKISKITGINSDAIRRVVGLRITRTPGYRYRNINPFAHTLGQGRADPPDFVLAERERRQLLEHQSITAAFCGDPPPGYFSKDRPFAEPEQKKPQNWRSNSSFIQRLREAENG